MTLNDVKRVLYVRREPSCKAMDVEVVSSNGILQSKGMIDLTLIVWNNIILILRKVMMCFLSP